MVRTAKTIGIAVAAAVLTVTALPAAAATTTAPRDGLVRFPGELTDSQKEAALLACTDPVLAQDGSSTLKIIDKHTVSRVLLREGTSSWGRAHIAKRYNEGATNHELTNYAKDRWSDAYNNGLWTEINTCYYKARWQYVTPGGTIRTMCIFFDLNGYGGKGSRGIITAYWKSGSVAC